MTCVKLHSYLLFVAFSVVFNPLLLVSGAVDQGLRLSIDTAQFLDSSSDSYVEIYYAIPEAGIAYVKNEAGLFGCQLVLDLEIYLDESLWTNKIWKIEKTVPDTLNVSAESELVDLLRYQVSEPGEYRVVMHIRNMHETNSVDSVETKIGVRSFQNMRVEVSDVQLSSKIERSAADSQKKFEKNGYSVTPSPSAFYGGKFANIYYYFEAYGLLKNIEGDRYKAISKVEDSQGQVIDGIGINYRTKRKINDASVEIGMVNVAGLPSGKYQLIYGIADDQKSSIVTQKKEFFVYNPGVDVGDGFADDELGPLANFSMAEIDDEFDRMVFVNTKADREFYANLDNRKAKARYILSIWQRENQDNMAPASYRAQYLGRARYAENQFKSVFSLGWKSDRGRVFILYGPPSDVQRFASTEGTVPYQIWTYNKLRGQGGVIFVFSDKLGFNKYDLLHSSLNGERSDLDWKSLVFRGGAERTFRIR